MEYLRIKKDYRLREEPNDAIIFNRNIDKMGSKIHRIPKTHYGILQLINGQFTRNDLAKIYSSTFNIEIDKSLNIINSFLNQYEEYIETIDTIDISNDLCVTKKQLLDLDKEIKSMHRLASPLFISLVLTYRCNCNCKYCFVNASKNSKRESLDLSTILNLLEESKDIGVAGVNITGGDPFINDNIYLILQKCIESDIEINVSTKERLNENQIKQLKEIGLKKIQISLDTLDNKRSEYLTGIHKFAENMLNTISILINNDIDVIVNSVTTKINIKDLPDLITRLNKMGVKKHFVSPYLKTLGRHDVNLFPEYEDYKELDEFIYAYNGEMIIDYKSPDYELVNQKSLDYIHRCTGGRMGLVINPYGDVSICERMIDNKECIVGNVNKQSILEIWKSNSLKKLIHPDKELFKGSDCYECENFHECVIDKGLCYARSKMVYGSIFNKDPLCPKEERQYRFV